MWLSLAALLLAANPGQDEAQEAFQRMEQPILKCKTLQVQVEIAIAPGNNNSLKGRLVVAQGNKMRLDLDGTVNGKAGKMGIVSNGAKMQATSANAARQDRETPKQASELSKASLARTGIFTPLFLPVEAGGSGQRLKEFDLDKEFAISDIKIGKKEEVAGKQAQTIEYKIATKTLKEPLAVVVWIDPKTQLPLKRVVTVRTDTARITFTETYSKAVLDEEIDDKEFKLPK